MDGAVVAGELLVTGLLGGGGLGTREDGAYGDHVKDQREHREREAGTGGSGGRVGYSHPQHRRETRRDTHDVAQDAVDEAEVERCEQYRPEHHQDTLDKEHRRALLVGLLHRVEAVGEVRVGQDRHPDHRPYRAGGQEPRGEQAEPEGREDRA